MRAFRRGTAPRDQEEHLASWKLEGCGMRAAITVHIGAQVVGAELSLGFILGVVYWHSNCVRARCAGLVAFDGRLALGVVVKP